MRQLALLTGLIAFTTAARADDKKPADAKPAAAKNAEKKAANAKPMPPDVSKTGAIMLAAGDIKWTSDPKRPGTYMALAEGDPDKGPAHFFLKYDKGFAGGLHYHTNDHGGWILQGTVILVVDTVETKLPAGSFYFIKGKKPHIAKCDAAADCVMTVDVRGKWDAVSEPAPKK